jgi:hypothetical protein
MNPDTADRITATIPEFRRLSGIGRSRIYELLDAGDLESIHIGVRRLILLDSYRRLIERLRAAVSDRAPTPQRPPVVPPRRGRRQAPRPAPEPA